MPSLTVRSLAELLRLPAYQQMRILSEQKYPKQEPQVFRTPYYSPALTGIRRYFQKDNDPSQLAAAKNNIQSVVLKSKRVNNLRVLDAFSKSEMSGRKLALQPNIKAREVISTVELKLSPDLQTLEDGKPHIFFLNCRAAALDDETAVFTCEIAHRVLEHNGIKVPVSNIEYVDLFTGTTYRANKRRASTMKAVTQNTKIIEALWPTL